MSYLTALYLIWFLLVASAVMLGIGILAGIGWCIWKAWEWFQDRRTDKEISAAVKTLSDEEVAELFEPRYKPITMRDFKVVDRISGHELRNALPEDEIGGAA